MARILLSYAHEDLRFARWLADRLRSAGHEPLVLGDRIRPGESIASVFLNLLDQADVFIPIMSTAAERSQWVSMEISVVASARRVPTLPVLLSAASALALHLRDRAGIDFSDEHHRDVAFAALARSLAPGSLPPPTSDERSPHALTLASAEPTRDSAELAQVEVVRRLLARKLLHDLIVAVAMGLGVVALLGTIANGLNILGRFGETPTVPMLVGASIMSGYLLARLMSVGRELVGRGGAASEARSRGKL